MNESIRSIFYVAAIKASIVDFFGYFAFRCGIRNACSKLTHVSRYHAIDVWVRVRWVYASIAQSPAGVNTISIAVFRN